MATRILVYESWTDEDSRVVGIRNSAGDVCVSDDPARLLSFLRYSAGGVVRAAWNLDEFVAPVLRLLPRAVLEGVARHAEDAQYDGHELYYLDNRSFRVGRARFYGLNVFWPAQTAEPADLAEVQAMADDLSSTLDSLGLGDFRTLVSPIAVFAESDWGRRVYDSIPKCYNLPHSCFQAIEYASACDKREWVSAYQLGHWGSGEIWDYDCNAMYPSVASELLDMNELEFWKSERFGQREEQAMYGFLRGKLFIDPDSDLVHCSPVMADVVVDSYGYKVLPGNPAGDFGSDYYLTLDELRFIQRYDLGRFEMADGWFLKPYGGTRPRRPFKDIMERLYQMRAKSDLASSVAKGIANQLVGKMIETRVDGNYGELRNDIYHALVLARARVKLAEFLMQNCVMRDELVAVQTDGVRLTRYVPVRGNGLGSWRCNGSFATLVASPYRVYTQDKRPGRLTYDDVVGMIKARPQSSYYERKVMQRVTLRMALQRDDIVQVGSLEETPVHLDLVELEREQNRKFRRLPKTGRSLLTRRYQSSPFILDS